VFVCRVLRVCVCVCRVLRVCVCVVCYVYVCVCVVCYVYVSVRGRVSICMCVNLLSTLPMNDHAGAQNDSVKLLTTLSGLRSC
jgi:hypothetical protein